MRRISERPLGRIGLAELDLTPRTRAALERAGMKDLAAILAKTEAELLAIPNFGRKGLNEVEAVLTVLGLSVSQSPAERLARELSLIAQEWQQRGRGRRGQSPFDRQSGYLKRVVAELVHDLTRTIGKPAAMEQLRELSAQPPRERSASSLEYALLGAIVGDDMSRVEKHRYADELEYAARHLVPPEYLVGFLLQLGPHASWKARVKDGHEPWFDEARASCIQKCLAEPN